MTLAEATDWLARGAGLAAAVPALELLWVREALSDAGVFSWPVLRAELGGPRWLRRLADGALSYRGIVAVLVVQLAAAVMLPWWPHPALPWLVFACALTVSVRFRGSYNGGSDAMLLVVLLALGLARSAPGSPLAAAGLAYAAVQLVLSYFIAGIAKLGEPAWRSGRALPLLVRLPQYRAPAWATAVLARRWIACGAGWLMLVFECASPLALLHPALCAGFTIIAVAFHISNAVVFGLDRFLWTWLAAYPALLYWAQRASA